MIFIGVWVGTLGYALAYKGLLTIQHYPSAFWTGIIGSSTPSGGTGYPNPAGDTTAAPPGAVPRGA